MFVSIGTRSSREDARLMSSITLSVSLWLLIFHMDLNPLALHLHIVAHKQQTPDTMAHVVMRLPRLNWFHSLITLKICDFDVLILPRGRRQPRWYQAAVGLERPQWHKVISSSSCFRFNGPKWLPEGGTDNEEPTTPKAYPALCCLHFRRSNLYYYRVDEKWKSAGISPK